MEIIIKLIVMGVATGAAGLLFSGLIMGQKRYAPLVQSVSAKDPFRGFYVAGFSLCQLLRINFASPRAQRRIAQCAVIHGEKYAEYHYRLLVAKQITIPLLVLVVALSLSVILDTPILILLALVAAAGVAYYFETTVTDIMTARSRAINREFPTVVSTLALLVNAGLIVREAWERISQSGEGVLYEEMRLAVLNMNNGVSEGQAYLDFARRCREESVTKFAASLNQNLTKGNRELVDFLRQYAAESWQERKQAVRVRGEEASTKLLIPITIMTLGLLIMLCVPIMSGIAF